jgi:hypothetical protein
MVLYRIPSLDPALAVTVGWDPELASFVARVDGVAPAPRRDPEDGVVAWFGTRSAELAIVADLQQAIRGYALIRPDVRAALEVDQAAGRNGDRPPPRPEPRRPAGVGLLAVVLLVLVVAVAVAVLALWPTP